MMKLEMNVNFLFYQLKIYHNLSYKLMLNNLLVKRKERKNKKRKHKNKKVIN